MNERFCMIVAYRVQAKSMRSAPCNKCKSGRQTESDSWCLGCSSQEITLQLFKRRWQQLGLRAIAEEAALNCARYVRALHNLDSALEQRLALKRTLQLSPSPRGLPGVPCGTNDLRC